MTQPVDPRALAKDVFTLKQQLDNELYIFAERVQSRNPTMAELEILVDQTSAEMTAGLASYIKKSLRRLGGAPARFHPPKPGKS